MNYLIERLFFLLIFSDVTKLLQLNKLARDIIRHFRDQKQSFFFIVLTPYKKIDFLTRENTESRLKIEFTYRNINRIYLFSLFFVVVIVQFFFNIGM